jgi:hypothetical protein
MPRTPQRVLTNARTSLLVFRRHTAPNTLVATEEGLITKTGLPRHFSLTFPV